MALPAAIVIAAAAYAARSPSARASFTAAYAAFRDPTRVHDRARGSADGDPPPTAVELEQPEIGGDFDALSEPVLADAGDGVPGVPLVMPDLGIAPSARTMHFVSYFTTDEKGRQAFIDRFRRAGRYREHIEQALRDADLPEDLLWLVAIESGFNPQAVSPKGAAGLFQFMPETGARYGLTQSEGVDERRSIPRSTAAGVAHLRDLFELYQQWDLALAAYNWGQDSVDEAIDKLRARRGPKDEGKPIEVKDLAEARLIPKETANFVPQIQAFAIVAANRGRFGLDDLDPAPPFELGEIAVPAGTHLRFVAKAAGVSIAVLRDYNPDLLRDEAPQGGSDAIVLVPAERVSRTLAAFPSIIQKEDNRRERLLAAAEASAAAASASAAGAAEPPPDRWTLPNGVVVERRPGPGADAVIAARVEVMRASRARLEPAGKSFEVKPITARPGELGPALERAAQAIQELTASTGAAALEARRRAGEARRRTLETVPYGQSWLALADKLFAQGAALEGTIPITPTMPLQSVAMADGLGRAPIRVTVTVTGSVDRAALAAAAERSLAAAIGRGAALPEHPREDRASVTLGVPSARILFGWIAPPDGDDGAALRVAMIALAHNESGKAARALVVEQHVAVHVRGFLDTGDRASLVAIEAVPAVRHDVNDVARELDRAIQSFADKGVTDAELGQWKGQLRARLVAERSRGATPEESKEATLARVARVEGQLGNVTAEGLASLVKRVFTRGHRVVVTTEPR